MSRQREAKKGRQLTLDDLEKIFDETGQILNEVSYLVRDMTSITELVGNERREHGKDGFSPVLNA
jgi:hypothetical protein